jgi:hypothetical protein
MRLSPRRFLAAIAFGCGLLALPSIAFAQGATLRGRVLSSATRQPIANATVTITELARETRTDSLGQFTLRELRAGEVTLVVQAVGFGPARATVPLTGGPPLELDVDLDPLSTVLDSVVTEADADTPRNIAMKDFESRRAMGIGRFITRADLLTNRGRTLDAVLRARLPAVRLVNDGGQILATSGRGSISIITLIADRCLVNVIVDDMLRFANGTGMPPFDVRSLEASMMAGVEFYTPASTPERFNVRGNAPCGTLVIWLQN